MSYFLIDFENTHSGGINDLKGITAEDTVEIFYSDSVNSMTFDLHTKILQSPASFIYSKITNGTKNALDFILLTKLARLADKYPDQNFFIISKDKGFDVICDFWKNENIRVERIEEISRFEKALAKTPVSADITVKIIADSSQTDSAETEPPANSAEQAAPSAPAENEPAAEQTDAQVSAAQPVSDLPETVQSPEKTAAEKPQRRNQRKPANKRRQPSKKSAADAQSSAAPDSPAETSAAVTSAAQPAAKADPQTNQLNDITAQLAAAEVADAAEVAQTVILYIDKYKTKQGIHNALVKKYPSKDNERAAGIYKAIKTFIKDKK